MGFWKSSKENNKAKGKNYPNLSEAVADFMDNITLYSRFPNRDVAQAFNTLQYRERLSETDRDLDSIPLIKKLKSYLNINPSKDDADAMFRDRMKLIINDSINKYIKTLERLRL